MYQSDYHSIICIFVIGLPSIYYFHLASFETIDYIDKAALRPLDNDKSLGFHQVFKNHVAIWR